MGKLTTEELLNKKRLENRELKDEVKQQHIRIKELEEENDKLKIYHTLNNDDLWQSEIIKQYKIPKMTLRRHIEKENLMPIRQEGKRKIFSRIDVEIYIKKFAVKQSSGKQKKPIKKIKKSRLGPTLNNHI